MTADTNVFVYAVDQREPYKQAIALSIVRALQTHRQPIGLQLVGEYQNVCRKKLKMPSIRAARLASDLLGDFSTFAYAEDDVGRALAQAALGRVSYWDALLTASAAGAGCTGMLSEDMQDGAVLFGVEIVNPFGRTGVSPRAAALLGPS